MAYKNKEDRVEYAKKYYKENKEKIKKQVKYRKSITKNKGKQKLFTCISCNVEKILLNKYSSKGYFCSNKCEGEYRTKLGIENWINGNYIPSQNTIRRYILLIKGHKCEICGLSEWNGLPIPIEVDHIDGNANNNDYTNFRILCPNCHAQTPTFKFKNKGKGRKKRMDKYYLDKT